jgi:hypothetical protein
MRASRLTNNRESGTKRASLSLLEPIHLGIFERLVPNPPKNHFDPFLMDAYIVEETPSDAVESELDGGNVSISERPHYPRSDTQNKINNDRVTPNNVSSTKETFEEATPKANPSMLPASNIPNNNPTRPTIQRSVSAAASYHRNRQNLSTGPSPPSAMPTEYPTTFTDNAPMITVVPASPLTSTGASRAETIPDNLQSVAEPSTRGRRDSTSENRSSRRRSEIDVSYCTFVHSSLTNEGPQSRRPIEGFPASSQIFCICEKGTVFHHRHLTLLLHDQHRLP